MSDLIKLVQVANPQRKTKHIKRRLLKLGEEYGEVVQAYLAVSSKNNTKNKTWCDVREELCDVLIVTLDILLTTMPDEDSLSSNVDHDITVRIVDETIRKINKWQHKPTLSKKEQAKDGG